MLIYLVFSRAHVCYLGGRSRHATMATLRVAWPPSIGKPPMEPSSLLQWAARCSLAPGAATGIVDHHYHILDPGGSSFFRWTVPTLESAC